MKIHIEIDCTPEEVRAFFGQPDLRPIYDELLPVVQERLAEALRSMDTRTLVEQWLPLTTRGIEQWQRFWTQLAAAAVRGEDPSGKPGGGGGRGRKD